MGAFVMSLSQVDTASGTFKADFWAWSVCPTKELQPLKTLEFVNGVNVSGTLDSTLQRGTEWWSNRKFSGTFRQDFSLNAYPFDRQPLVIGIEEGVLDTRELIFTADSRNSGLDPGVDLPGWRMTGVRLVSGVARHPTTFGDPSLPDGESSYASLRLEVGMEPARVANFIKATFSVYVAVLLALVSLLIVDGRVGLLGGTMFAVVLSFSSVDRIVGPHDGIYLLDQIHFAALALIMAATVRGVMSLRAVERNQDRALRLRQDTRWAIGLLATYVVTNIVMVGMAISA